MVDTGTAAELAAAQAGFCLPLFAIQQFTPTLKTAMETPGWWADASTQATR
jgi:hypothetical protein